MTPVDLAQVTVPALGAAAAVVGLPVLYLVEHRRYRREIATAGQRLHAAELGRDDELVFDPWPHEELRHLTRGLRA